jgi:hypothetical protein
MTDEDIHNIYTHMSGKAEGIAEITGSADFPVLFARGILELDRMDRKWVGLTNGEMIEISEMELGRWDLILEVEAKLKEKNT